MPRLNVEITLQDKGVERTERVIANGRDIRAYEAEFDESFLTQTTYTQLAKIAWIALRRAGRFTGTYDEFDAQAVDLEEFSGDSEVDPVDPTQTDPGAGS